MNIVVKLNAAVMELSREGRSPNKTSKKSDGQCSKSMGPRAPRSELLFLIFLVCMF